MPTEMKADNRSKDKVLADTLIEATHIFNKCLRDCMRAGLEVDLDSSTDYHAKPRTRTYSVRIYRSQPDIVIAESPKQPEGKR
jgi:hypothetical protein